MVSSKQLGEHHIATYWKICKVSGDTEKFLEGLEAWSWG